MNKRYRLLLWSCTVFIAIAAMSFSACDLDSPVGWPSFTVAYNANGGSGSMVNSRHRHGEAQNLTTNAFTRTGHSFVGWARSPDGAIEFYDAQSVTNLTKTDGEIVTLYARWGAHSFTVVYLANGGDGTMEDSIFSYNNEDKNLRPNAFTHPDDVLFLGWARSPSGHVEFHDGESIRNLTAEDGEVIRLYARWGTGTFTVTFDLNGGSGTAPIDEVIEAGSSILLPGNDGFSKSGEYIFGGWNDSTDGTGTNFSAGTAFTPDSNITLYARWIKVEATTFTVAFNVNSGTGTVPTPETVAEGSSITLPDGGGFSRSGYIFSGWNIRNDGTGIDFSPGTTFTPDGNITLYARWISSIAVPGATLTARLAWLQLNAQSGGRYFIELTSNASIAPYTLYFSDRNNITVTLGGSGQQRSITPSANGSLLTVNSGVTLILDENITLQGRPVNNNAPLVQVNDGGILVMNAGARIAGNFNPIAANSGGGVRVNSGGTFNMQGGGLSSNSTNGDGGGVFNAGTFQISGGTIYGDDAPAAFRNIAGGHGWASLFNIGTAQRGTFNATGDFTPLGNLATTNVTIHAANGVLRQLAGVSFNANGGMGTTPAAQTVISGYAITLPDGSGFSRSGFTFAGWNTRADGTGTDFTAGAAFVPTGDITLYAIWVDLGESNVPGATLAAQLSWLQTNAQTGGRYHIVLTGDVSQAPHSLVFSGRSDIVVALVGGAAMRTLNLSSSGSMFTINSGVTLVLDNNVTIQGISGNNNHLIRINGGGTLVMNAGSRVTGNNNTASTSSFNDGGGVRVNPGSTFIMHSGTIDNNGCNWLGGGVDISGGGTFNMHGGEIFGNRASISGGGIRNSGTFRISGGTIYGNAAGLRIRNTALDGAALSTTGTAQRGTFNPAGVFSLLGTFGSTNNTIRVLNGVLQ